MTAPDIVMIVTSIGGVIIGVINAWKLQAVQKNTDGLKDELVLTTAKANFAKGVKSQKDDSEQAMARDEKNFARGVKSETDKQ